MVWVAISFFSGTAKLQWGLALHIRGPDVAEDEGPGRAPRRGRGAALARHQEHACTRSGLAPAARWTQSLVSFLSTPKGIFIKGLWSVKIKGNTAAPGQVFLRFPCQAGSCQNGLPALATCAGADGWGLRAAGGLGVRSHPWLCHRFS